MTACWLCTEELTAGRNTAAKHANFVELKQTMKCVHSLNEMRNNAKYYKTSQTCNATTYLMLDVANP